MALRITGSVIGEPITSSSSSATGMWTSQEVAALQKDGIWQISPTFTLTPSASNVNEGASITITLTTTGIPNGVAVPYVITGANVYANDFSSGNITGNFVIQNGSNTISFTASADSTTEGAETLTITAGGASASVTINDTSTDTDAQFSYTTLLLKGDGTNNAQNNTFLDASTNNITITRNGNSTQGTFTPYGSNWSTYIPSAGQTYFTAGSSSSLALGAGDFTIECWLYIDALAPSYSTIIDWRSAGAIPSGVPVLTDLNNNGKLAFIFGNGAAFTTVVESSTTMPLKSWFHLAVVRSGTTVTMYFNGTSVGSGTSSVNYGIESFNVSNPQAANYNPAMYISNLRLVKGSAVYTTTFTPSTTPLTAITNTQLLACQSNRLIDNSTNNFSLSKIQTISIQKFSPFSPASAYSASTNGGSVYFDGTGDYLINGPYSGQGLFTPSYSTAQNKAATIEFWVYPTSTGEGRPYNYCLPSIGNGNDIGVFCVLLGSSSSYQVQFGWYNQTAQYVVIGGAAYPYTWTHIALTYEPNGGVGTLYINGKSVGTVSGGNVNGGPPNTLNGAYNYIGYYPGLGIYFTGYISDFRYVLGTKIYTGDFIPPTAPLLSSGSTSSYSNTANVNTTFPAGNTSMLCNFTNAGIIDNTMINNLETRGTAKISTTQSKFGGSSIFFNGTSDYLFLPAPSLNLSKWLTSNFTIEFWAYLTDSSVDRTIISAVNNWAAGANFNIEVRTGGLMHVQIGNSVTMTSGSISFPLNQWNHVALVRDGATSTKLFLNGTLRVTDTTNWTSDEDCPMTIGCFNINGGSIANYWNGYIDDLRITRGYARYTSTFTPPALSFSSK